MERQFDNSDVRPGRSAILDPLVVVRKAAQVGRRQRADFICRRFDPTDRQGCSGRRF